MCRLTAMPCVATSTTFARRSTGRSTAPCCTPCRREAIGWRTMARGRGVGARLGRAFLLQAAFIAVAAAVSVFLANVLLEDVLIRQALRDEANFFWDRRTANPSHPLPATLNLSGYLADAPPDLATLGPGFHERNDSAHRT